MDTRTRPSCLWISYAATVFISAFLLFQVQPIISKYILPWFGGSPAVWTTCMVFFQTLLFAGYAYAHFSERWLKPWARTLVHVGLLGAALLALPIVPDVDWKPTGNEAPTWRILCLLAATVGLPYFVLASTGPLVQAWFSRSYPGRSPYRLYSLSNIGSLLALLSYPFYVEGAFDVPSQAWLWKFGFIAFALLCGYGAIRAGRATSATVQEADDSSQAVDRPTLQTRLLWLALPAFASVMLLATTNHVCQDVAVIPFLWVVPLSLYLLSFIICFDHARWYWRRTYAVATLASLCIVAGMDKLITGGAGISFSFRLELVLHFAALFFVCMLCHGELVRLRPHPRHLTSFYLMISAGGALGGMFVSLVAPEIFSTFFEWKLGLVAGCLLAALVIVGTEQATRFQRRFRLAVPMLFVAFLGLNCVPQFQAGRGEATFAVLRNFYGVVSSLEADIDLPDQHKFSFYSGRIVHGLQFVEPNRAAEPTAYFGAQSGVGRTLAYAQQKPQLRVGVVGLGIGTLASYARPNDSYRFYEINPNVLTMAERYFSYLKDCPGTIEIVLGDGRLSLEREAPQQFDVLVLDAFSGDAVPTHLLTAEAFAIYMRHLAKDGVIAVNVSNRYLNIAPIVRRLGAHVGFDARHVSSEGDAERGLFAAEWIILARDKQLLAELQASDRTDDGLAGPAPLWTDSHSNLFQILK